MDTAAAITRKGLFGPHSDVLDCNRSREVSPVQRNQTRDFPGTHGEPDAQLGRAGGGPPELLPQHQLPIDILVSSIWRPDQLEVLIVVGEVSTGSPHPRVIPAIEEDVAGARAVIVAGPVVLRLP